jgi:HAD superfamily hydrolase (TIGR01509 family)
VKAVVFDCDGVLVDSEAAWTRALRDVLVSHDVSLADVRAGAMIGGSVPEVVDFMEHQLSCVVDAEEISREIYASVLESVSHGIEAMHGAIELLETLKGTCLMAVASNGSLATVHASLRAAGIPDVFDAVVALGSTTRPKPAPDLYLEACSLLSVSPSDALAIEDSTRGATAAKRAGMSVVGVGSAAGLDDVCDLVVSNLLDVRLLELVGTVAT